MQYRKDKNGDELSLLGYGCMRFSKKGGGIDVAKAEQELLKEGTPLSEVQRLCDRVAILREGRLVGLQSMEELRENGYKKISLTARKPVEKNFFSIPGVANLEQADASVSFMFSGNTMTIMDRLHQLELEDIFIEEPSLEEIFLHYYE